VTNGLDPNQGRILGEAMQAVHADDHAGVVALLLQAGAARPAAAGGRPAARVVLNGTGAA
jgi:hypothetical protein